MAPDEELVGRIAQGEDGALAELLRRYERPLSSFLYRHTGGRDVEDLFQETWTRVFRHARSFDPTRRFSTWLFQIALNLARDWHRRPRQEADDIASEDLEAGGIAQVEASLDAARLLGGLSEQHREVVILRFYHDLSEEQVAEIVGCPRGTVKSRLHHALVRLGEAVRAERASAEERS